MKLTPLQQRELARRAFRWVSTIEHLNQAGDRLNEHPNHTRDGLNENPSNQDLGYDNELHLLMISLEHLDNCLKYLVTDSLDDRFKELGTRYRESWRPPRQVQGTPEDEPPITREVRDALEHEEEYIAGPGRFPDSATDEWRETFQSGTFMWDDDGINVLVVLGKGYEVKNAIRSALALKEALTALADVELEV